MDLSWIRARLESLDTLASRALALVLITETAAASVVAKLLGISRIQAGLSTMVNGITPVIPVQALTASSTITVSYKTLNGNALTVELSPTAYVLGTPGSFRVEALLAGGAGNAADQSEISWHLINSP